MGACEQRPSVAARVMRLLVGLLVCVLALSQTGCLEEKPVPRSEKAESIEVVEDRPESTEKSADSAAASEAAKAESAHEEAPEEAPPAEKVVEQPAQQSGVASARLLDGFSALSQYPELPNGCEITSLAAVLNYCGYPVSKTTLSDSYLAKAPVGQANFYYEFVGNPRDSDAYGCYAPVIVSAANSYLSSIGSTMSARDITGSSPEDLYSCIDRGIPVVVWATRYLEAGHYSVTWYVDGQSLTWYTPEHCLALVGYDKTSRLVQLADPLEGEVISYDMDLFEQRYAELKNQAVVIE